MGDVSYIRVSTFVCVLVGLADHRLSGQTAAPDVTQFGIRAVTHETHAELQTSSELANTNELRTGNETFLLPPPTRGSFMATWLGVTDATRFLRDVSTSSSFSSFVDGYHDVHVGNVTGRVITG